MDDVALHREARTLPLATKNVTLRYAVVQRNWQYVASKWSASGGFHGLPTIAAEDRTWLIAEAEKDGVDLLDLADERKSAGRPSLYGERMEGHSFMLTADQWQKIQAHGGSEWLRGLIDSAAPAAKQG